MFINTSIFKKMVKNAYESGGLSVARQRQKYVIAGEWWCLKVRADAFPAKGKAAVVEFVSEFPQIGDMYIACKSEEKRNAEFGGRWEEITNEEYITPRPDRIVAPLPTCIHLQSKSIEYRVWQQEDNNILFVPQQVDELVSARFIDKKIEQEPDAPICLFPESVMCDKLYWKNNCCELWVACAREIFSDRGIQKSEKVTAINSIRWPQALDIIV